MTGKTGAVYIGANKIASMDDWSLDAKVDTVDITCFEDTWHALAATFMGASGSCSGVYEAGSTNIDVWTAFLTAAVVTLKLYPASGVVEYFTCSAFIDFSIKVAANGKITFTGPFKVTGAVSRALT